MSILLVLVVVPAVFKVGTGSNLEPLSTPNNFTRETVRAPAHGRSLISRYYDYSCSILQKKNLTTIPFAVCYKKDIPAHSRRLPPRASRHWYGACDLLGQLFNHRSSDLRAS
jgi:hypothetical protein